MMKGGHGQTNQLHDVNWGALDHASRAPQLMPHNYHVCVCVCACVCVYVCVCLCVHVCALREGGGASDITSSYVCLSVCRATRSMLSFERRKLLPGCRE